ncbi:hypothetical protein [Leifsonia sp. 2MCAF36]|uniref:hypothetical protein n=1 Tax=Leifsonia sp. 2MCAF36 TaxID=3232988 RepID=UPI003F9C318B
MESSDGAAHGERAEDDTPSYETGAVDALEAQLSDSSAALAQALSATNSWSQATKLYPSLFPRVSDALKGFDSLVAGQNFLRGVDLSKSAQFALGSELSKSLRVPTALWAARMNELLPRADFSQLVPNLPNLLSSYRLIERQLSQLNTPTYADATQAFLAQSGQVRYRGRQRVWHYTGAHALMQILSKHELWASSPHHLNDTSELTHGVGIIRQAIERARDEGISGIREDGALRELVAPAFVEDAMHEIYFISASTANDSLTLWRNYSTTDGFAIGLSPAERLAADGLVPGDGSPGEDVSGWYKVHYIDADKARLAYTFVESALHDLRATSESDWPAAILELRKHLVILASTMKHRSFMDEREVRWITTLWAPLDVVHYEVTQRGIVPIIHARTIASEDTSHLPIRGVRCSPRTAPTIVHTIKGLLEKRKYELAARDVVRSELPFRG